MFLLLFFFFFLNFIFCYLPYFLLATQGFRYDTATQVHAKREDASDARAISRLSMIGPTVAVVAWTLSRSTSRPSLRYARVPLCLVGVSESKTIERSEMGKNRGITKDLPEKSSKSLIILLTRKSYYLTCDPFSITINS